MEHHESKYAVITHTNDPWGGVKRSFFSSKGKNLNLRTPLTSGVGFKGQISRELSNKTYLTGICYDLNNTEGELKGLDKMGFMFCDLHVSLNNPSSGDINSSNLSCS